MLNMFKKERVVSRIAGVCCPNSIAELSRNSVTCVPTHVVLENHNAPDRVRVSGMDMRSMELRAIPTSLVRGESRPNQTDIGCESGEYAGDFCISGNDCTDFVMALDIDHARHSKARLQYRAFKDRNDTVGGYYKAKVKSSIGTAKDALTFDFARSVMLVEIECNGQDIKHIKMFTSVDYMILHTTKRIVIMLAEPVHHLTMTLVRGTTNFAPRAYNRKYKEQHQFNLEDCPIPSVTFNEALEVVRGNKNVSQVIG